MTATEVLALSAIGVALLALLFAAIACDAAKTREAAERAARRRVITPEQRAACRDRARVAQERRELADMIPAGAPNFGPWARHTIGCKCNVCR